MLQQRLLSRRINPDCQTKRLLLLLPRATNNSAEKQAAGADVKTRKLSFLHINDTEKFISNYDVIGNWFRPQI